MTTFFTMLGTSFALVILLMLFLWVIYLFKGNAGIVDVGWGIGFIISAWTYFILGTGDFIKMLILTLMVTVWAGRLTYYLYQRYRAALIEEPRYTTLRNQWGVNAFFLFLGMFIFQGVLVVILSMPFLLVSAWSTNVWSLWEVWGVALWAVGVIGESIADNQLKVFITDPLNKGKVFRKGLWRFSRHPNYFFEFIVWLGFALFAYPTAWGYLALVAPVIMFILLFKVSGIPMTESQALLSKGEEYREYQRTTSMFIPWFPKM